MSTIYAGGQAAAKTAVMGALRLYLDFINLFMMLLQLLGVRRNDYCPPRASCNHTGARSGTT
jgi:FtsH-binding integral membrane protein